MANNATFALGPIGGGARLHSVAVTAATTVYNPPLTKLYVGGTGNITIVSPGTGTVTLTAIPAGTFVDDVAILQLTTATATGLIGFW
jgi:DNA-binding beta-propeller fold protein YncE